MSWVTVTKENLRNYVVSALVDAIDESALGETQLERFTSVHADTIAEVRMAVASNENNILDSDTDKIPQSLRSAACWLICNYMAQGLQIQLTEQQQAEVTASREKLQAVANGDIAVETPDAPDSSPDAQGGAAVELASYSERIYTRDTMAGI
jgi:phage gp36-like protein